jgi:hypothetical protein
MPSKTLKTRATKSSTKSSSGSSSGTAAGTRATPRAATGKATSPGAATRKATSPRVATRKATSPRAATRKATSPGAATRKATSPGVATGRATSPRAAAAFAAAVAAKDTNRFHNLPVDIQTEIMRMARERKKNSKGKYELYKKIYYNRQVFMDWLDEIKRDGVDDKMRVRNPLREGSMIYTNKNGLYSKLWHLCIQIFQGDYNIRGVPEPVKRYYKKAQLKFFNKPPQ